MRYKNRYSACCKALIQRKYSPNWGSPSLHYCMECHNKCEFLPEDEVIYIYYNKPMSLKLVSSNKFFKNDVNIRLRFSQLQITTANLDDVKSKKACIQDNKYVCYYTNNIIKEGTYFLDKELSNENKLVYEIKFKS